MDVATTTVSDIIKWFDPTKGFGFVIDDDGGPDVFLHARVVHETGYFFHFQFAHQIAAMRLNSF